MILWTVRSHTKCYSDHSYLLFKLSLTSICIFAILFSIYFLKCWQGEFAKQSRSSVVCDYFLYSGDLNFWIRGNIVRRTKSLWSLLAVKGLKPGKHFWGNHLRWYACTARKLNYFENVCVYSRAFIITVCRNRVWQW